MFDLLASAVFSTALFLFGCSDKGMCDEGGDGGGTG